MKRQPHNDTHARSARKMARSVVLLLALLAPLVSTTLLAAPPPITNVYQVPAGATAVPVGSFPQGIFTNWTSVPAKQAAILRDPDVAGVGLDLTWPDLEPASGHYQWAALDTPLAAVNGHKQILLRLTSGGAHTPAWVLQQSQTFSFNDPNPYHATAGQAVTSDLGSWQIIKDHALAVAGQMLWFVSGDATCRMNGRQTPCDPATVLTTAITTGVHYGMSYEEIYTADVLNPALASIIHHANELLTQQ